MFTDKIKEIAESLLEYGFDCYYAIANLDEVNVDDVLIRRVLIDGKDVNLSDALGNYFFIRYDGPIRSIVRKETTKRYKRRFRLVGSFNCPDGCSSPNMEALVFNLIDKLECYSTLFVIEADHYAPVVYKKETGLDLLTEFNAFYIDFEFSCSIKCKCKYDVCKCS